MLLKPYAVPLSETWGRTYEEAEDETRFPFQRDRDRIIHTQAFRRLKHKTQVFVADKGDHYRTR
ncbi:MAG: deoxyguanosinetriphosphate triphosphohydrolase, partial [Patescibacteria group bacterium]